MGLEQGRKLMSNSATMTKRIPFGTSRQPLDPKICNIGLDANALDCDGTERDQLTDRFRTLASDGTLTVVLGGGVRIEAQHPRTPADVKDALMPQIFNLRPSLNASQRTDRARVLAILQGSARPGKHAADASHLSEAAETGCGYFITHDKRVLNRRGELHAVLPPSLNIVSLDEFFEIFDRYAEARMGP
jgi:hypothetical protein